MRPMKKRLFNLADLLFPLVAFVLYELVNFVGYWVGRNFLIPSIFLHPKGFFNAMASTWDAGWYFSIASSGYAWSPSVHMQQNVAFFPLFPLLERASFLVLHQWSTICIVLIAVFFAIGSVYLFYYLAKEYFDAATAKILTFIFILFPGSLFLTAGYASSLELAGVLAVFLLCKKGYVLWAAVCAGVTTASGPLAVVLVIPVVWNDLFSVPYTIKKVIRMLILAIISELGLLAFIIYQWRVFHNPLAFIQVQQYWDPRTISMKEHMKEFLTANPLFSSLHYARVGFHAIHSGSFSLLQVETQMMIAFSAVILLLFLVITLVCLLCRVLPVSYIVYSFMVLLAYLYTKVPQVYFGDAPRLLYIDIPVFLSLGYIPKKIQWILLVILCLCSVLLYIFSMLHSAGYWIN